MSFYSLTLANFLFLNIRVIRPLQERKLLGVFKDKINEATFTTIITPLLSGGAID